MTALFRTLAIPLLVLLGGPLLPAQEKPLPEEPVSIGEQISRHIHKLALEERKKRLDFMHIVIDDIVRLCDLDEAQRERLVLAAKGAAERSMKRWHEQAERYFRSRVNGADADTAREILSNIGNVNFGGRGSDREGETESLWKDSLKNVLSENQIKTYEMVVARREQARIDAFSHMAIASLDNYLRLTPGQRDKLFPIVKQSATEHLEEIQRYWGDYLEKNMLMSLANAADEEVLKGILSEKQFLRLRSATTNFEHFWDQRKRIRKAKEKVGQKEEKKEEAPSTERKAVDGDAKPAPEGKVVIQPGAVFRGGNVVIKAGNITITPED